MKAKITYLAVTVFSAAVLLIGCQSAVRFTSDRDARIAKSKNASVNESKISTSVKSTGEQKTKKQPSETPVDNPGIYSEEIIAEAEKWLGVPYKWGGNDTSGTDCSGFVQSIFKSFGFSIPRTASDQFEFSEMIPEEEAKPGDLIFFRINDRIVHVGLYAGNNTMIHASTKSGVINQDLKKYFYYSKKENIAGFGRIIRN